MADTKSTQGHLSDSPIPMEQTNSQSSLEVMQQPGSHEKKDETAPETRLTTSPTSVPVPSTTSDHLVWNHLTATIKPTLLAEAELILLTIFTGMQDAVSFPDYHCFASNQTGNTVFLVLALILPELNGKMFVTANIGAALGFFLAAGWLTGQLSHIIGPRNRLWLIVCNFIQAGLVLTAGSIQYVYGIDLQGSRAIAVIGLLAFASGSQVVQSRSLAMTEISTAMATAAWVDLLIDPRLFTLNNRPRTRRIVFLVALVVGALLGAVIYRTVGSSIAILVSGGGKFIVACLYLFNKAEKLKVEDSSVFDALCARYGETRRRHHTSTFLGTTGRSNAHQNNHDIGYGQVQPPIIGTWEGATSKKKPKINRQPSPNPFFFSLSFKPSKQYTPACGRLWYKRTIAELSHVDPQPLGRPFLDSGFMTLNNLAEQLPWLLRNPKSTHPTGFSASSSSISGPSASASLTRPAGASSAALSTATPAAHSPTTAALISSFRQEPPPTKASSSSSSSSSNSNKNNKNNSNYTTTSSNTTAGATPRASNATGLPTPALTGSIPFPSLQLPSLANSNARDHNSPEVSRNTAVNRAVRQLPPPPPFPTATASAMPWNTPSRGHKQPALPSMSCLATAAATRGLSTPARSRPTASGHNMAMPAIPSSHTRRAKTPVAPSPFALDFGSDLDPDDFDSIVDLTTDDNTPANSSPRTTSREDVRLWREDFASRPEPSSSSRGRKRKSMEVHGSAEKSTPATKRKASAEQKRREKAAARDNESDGDDSDSIGDFPDVNDLVSLVSSSPIRTRHTSAKTPSRTPARAPARTPAKTLAKTPRKSPAQPVESPHSITPKSVTPRKKQAPESVRNDVVMDSEDEFVTPPTRNVSFVTCPNDSAMQDTVGDSDSNDNDDDDAPPPPHSPTFRTAQRVADTPHKNSPRDRVLKAPARPEPLLQEESDGDNDEDVAMGDSVIEQVPQAANASKGAPATAPVLGPEKAGSPLKLELAPVPVSGQPGEADEDEDMESTQKPGVMAYWPALRFKQHDVEEKLRKNATDYMKALREKSPTLRLRIKGEKEPLLKEKHAVDKLVDEFRSYANLYNDQEALLNAITEAYQSHQDTEVEEARLDGLTAELQDREESLRERLSAAAVDPSSCPSDFAAGSPHDPVVVPATQHPEGFVPQMMSRNNTSVSESPSQIVLQTQMAVPPQPRPVELHGNGTTRQFQTPVPRQQQNYSNSAYADDSHNMPDYFDDDDLFTGVENLPPMHTSNYGSSSSRQQPISYPPRAPPAATRGPDLFSDFSDDVEMLQVAEHFEMQHSSSAEMAPARPTPSRQILALTSGNTMAPPKEPVRAATRKLAATVPRSSQKAAIPPELMRFSWSQDVRRALKDRFRMSGFRHNQLEAINATLAGDDAFVLMPTGGGKSLCYQLPAVISSGKTSGVTIVISPLLSLMQDQVDHLKALNIAASSFNSSTPAAARKLVMDLFSKPQPEHFLQLLYVTPEMVSKSQHFVNGLATLYQNKKLARIVIDEAHCVSQWGHDFRPDYKALGKIRRQFPTVPVMALTATATPNVIVDIKHNLSIDGCKVFSQSFNRPNLYYEVRVKGAGCIDNIGAMIRSEYSGQTGIVYTLSQKSTESIAKKLSTKFGISAHHYHAGLKPEEKVQIQRDWQRGRIKVVVATIAFGMGIDKPDVRFVVHFYLPKSLEGYYQETGRAGRDSQQSNCYLYFGYGDIKSLRKFISDSDGSEAQKERQREMLNRMVDFCENQRDCRRTEILRYFGETFDPAHCGKTCDNCKSESKFDLTDFTEYAVAALEIVKAYELITMVQCCDILQASRRVKPDDEKYEQVQHVQGIAKQVRKQDLHKMIYRLLGEAALEEENIVVRRSDMAVQYLKIGRAARDFFSGRKRLQVVIKVNDIVAAVTAPKKTKATKKTVDGATDKPAKKSKATSKSKATASSSTEAGTKKKRKAPAAILDEAEVDDDDVEEDGSSDFENFDGPVHRNGYAKDNFVVSDNEEDIIIEEHDGDDDNDDEQERPRRQAAKTKTRQAQLQQYAYEETSQSRGPRKSQTPQRQRRLEELGGPIARDTRLSEANIDPVHADVIANFVDEARRLEEKIRNEKGMRILFTETHLREMAIGWTDTLDKMRRIQGIDSDHVRRYGPKFVPVIKRYYSIYQEMMGFDGGGGGDRDADGDGGYDSPLLGPISAARRPRGPSSSTAKTPSKSDLDAVVDLISSDEDDDDDDDSMAGGVGGVGGGIIQSSRETNEWRAQLETLQSQTGKSCGGGGSGGGRKFAKKGGFRGAFRKGSSRSSSGSHAKASRASSSGGVAKRKSTTASSMGGASSSRASGGGGSGIGIMPL